MTVLKGQDKLKGLWGGGGNGSSERKPVRKKAFEMWIKEVSNKKNKAHIGN